jgi:HK97 gp10 family phage protein
VANPFGVSGGEDIAKALKEFPLAMEVAMTRGGLRAGAVIIAEEAKSRVPVQSGALRNSIKVRTGKKKDGSAFAYVVAGTRELKRDASGNYKHGSKYNNPWYAHLVEYGVKRHVIIAGGGTKAGKALAAGARILGEKVDHPGADAKPFMRPALSTKAQSAIDRIADYLRTRIAKGK